MTNLKIKINPIITQNIFDKTKLEIMILGCIKIIIVFKLISNIFKHQKIQFVNISIIIKF